MKKNKYHMWDIYKIVLYKPDIVSHRAVLDRSVVQVYRGSRRMKSYGVLTLGLLSKESVWDHYHAYPSVSMQVGV